jgi:uncharacterized protein (DUF2225 family)
MAKRISTDNPNIYARTSSTKDTNGKDVWLVYGGDKLCQIAGTKDNRAAARKKLNRILESFQKAQPKISEKAKTIKQVSVISESNPSMLDSMVPNLIAKKSKTTDQNGRCIWSIFYLGVVIATISGTKDNRDAARRRLSHLEVRDDADLIKMGESLKTFSPALVQANVDLKPKPSKNSFVTVILRYEGSDDTTDVKFNMGEFVHSDNAVKRFNAMESVLKGFELALGSN